MIPSILDELTDEELKREAKNESKNDVISTIIRSCRHLLSRVPSQEEKMKEFEMFRLKMLLRFVRSNMDCTFCCNLKFFRSTEREELWLLIFRAERHENWN